MLINNSSSLHSSPPHYFSLVKMLYWMCERSQSDLTGDQLEHAIKRNFGGHEKMQTLEIFKSKISQLIRRSLQRENINVSGEVRREGR